MSTVKGARDWPSVASKFTWDGSLRDILIRECAVDDWMSLFKALGRTDRTQVILPASDREFWENSNEIFIRYRGQALSLSRDGIDLKCDLVSPELIEFDLDPRQVRDQTTLASLLSLMTDMSSILAKPVFLTEEGDHDAVLIEVEVDRKTGSA